MCGRYTLTKIEKLKSRFDVSTLSDLRPSYNVAPGQRMPVVIANESGMHKLVTMKWGLIPFWAKDPKVGYKLINARDDSVFDKPTWRKSILKRRCLVPADGFYEWRKPSSPKDHKQPFFIHPKQIDVFSFAGIWETWKDSDGQELSTYSIITTSPNKEMSKIHDRMPVILHPDDEGAWLDSSLDNRNDIEPFLQSYDDGLEMYKVSDEVNSPKNNSPELINSLS